MMDNSVFVMRIFLLFCYLAFWLISKGVSYAQKERKARKTKINRRKRLILLKEMAQRGFTQKYYTHPVYSEIEKTIKRYVKIMKDADGDLSHVAQVFLVRMVENEKLFKQLPYFMNKDRPGRYFLQAVDHFYEDKAIRPIKEWQPDPEDLISNNAMGLIAFLFESYPVPRHIASYWLRSSFDKRIQESLNELVGFPKENGLDGAFFDLYFHLAKGLNVRSWQPAFFKPSKKEAHVWMNTPDEKHLNLQDAFWRAVYLARGGGKSEYLVINVPLSLKQLSFWRQFIDILISEEQKNEPNLRGVSEMIHLISWIKFGEKSSMFNLTGMEKMKSSQPELSLKRERLSSLRKRVYGDPQAEYALPEGFREKYVFTDASGQLYQIKQLKNRLELQKEAEELSHCLGDWGYHVEALEGRSQFWSLRRMDKLPDGTTLVSIEISDSVIVEYQAACNTDPEPHIIKIIEQWAEENKMTVSTYG